MNQPQDFHIQRSKALWYAQLELGFQDDGERTIMKHRKHHGMDISLGLLHNIEWSLEDSLCGKGKIKIN